MPDTFPHDVEFYFTAFFSFYSIYGQVKYDRYQAILLENVSEIGTSEIKRYSSNLKRIIETRIDENNCEIIYRCGAKCPLDPEQDSRSHSKITKIYVTPWS